MNGFTAITGDAPLPEVQITNAWNKIKYAHMIAVKYGVAHNLFNLE